MCDYRVWHSVGSIQCHPEWIRKGYINTQQNSCPHVLSHFGSMLFRCIPWSFSGKGWLLTCIQHTRRLTRVQHTKYDLHASYYRTAHEVLLACSTRNIACVQYMKVDSRAVHLHSVTCIFLTLDKNWGTYACSPHASINLDVSCTILCVHSNK